MINSTTDIYIVLNTTCSNGGLKMENLHELLKDITKLNDITLNDIPNIDLYMDQVTTLFENHLHPLKRDKDDKILTKTMINNYSKAKIFPPVKSKKYNKEQIILLSLIYNLKQSLSLGDIGTVFSPILDDIKEENAKVDVLYDLFLNIKKEELLNFEKEFDEILSKIEEKISHSFSNVKDNNILILLILTLIAKANMNIRMSEKIIDNFFKKSE